MSVPAHLTITTDALSFDSLLADWRWLVHPGYTPVLMTAFGDLFLRGASPNESRQPTPGDRFAAFLANNRRGKHYSAAPAVRLVAALLAVLLHSIPLAEAQVPPLLNFNFGAGANVKTGFAAIGNSPSDYWNPVNPLVLAPGNFEWSDETPCSATLSLSPFGVWGLSTGDPMYDTYLYNYWPTQLVLSNLSSGQYDFFIYGHGDGDIANGVYDLQSGTIDYGVQATATSTTAWTSDAWQLGVQYVVYSNVVVISNAAVNLFCLADSATPWPASLINGMQLRFHPMSAPAFAVEPQGFISYPGNPAQLSAGAAGTEPISFQ